MNWIKAHKDFPRQKSYVIFVTNFDKIFFGKYEDCMYFPLGDDCLGMGINQAPRENFKEAIAVKYWIYVDNIPVP